MLRQVFRNRGVYNFVQNVPYASTQEDCSNWVDPNYDWRQQQTDGMENWGPQYAQPSHYPVAQYATGPHYGPPLQYASQPQYAAPMPAYTPWQQQNPAWEWRSQQFRGDPNLDWRRHYNPAAQPEFREDIGLEAWDRPDWWTDLSLSSTAAAKILRKRLQTYGPQKEKSLQEVFSRIRSEKDARAALKTAELFRRYRATREQHTPFKTSTSKLIVERALEVDADEVAVQALERKDELGFNFLSLKAYRAAMTHFSAKGDLKNVVKVFELSKKQGLKPNRDIGFCVCRACLDCNDPNLAYAYAVEFQENGIRISPAQKVLIEAGSKKKLPPFQGEEAEHADEDDEEGSEIFDQADAIIAAANADSNQKEVPVSVNSEEVGETVTEGGETVREGEKIITEEELPQGSSTKVVAAVSVEPLPEPTTEPQIEVVEEVRDVSALPDVPGLSDEVNKSMKALFPPKESKSAPELRRVNSI